MKKRSLVLIFFISATVIFLALYSITGAGDGKKGILQALETAFDLIPEDGYLVTAEDLDKRMRSGKTDFIIVDVRPKFEDYEEGHIPGAIYVPWRETVSEDALHKLPKDKDIILYSSTGHLEHQSLIALRTLGYKAFALRWGMLSWTKTRLTEQSIDAIKKGANAAYPVTKGTDAKLKEERRKKALEHTGC